MVDATTLRPRIVDPGGFAADRAGDAMLPVLQCLWGGDPASARVLLTDLPSGYQRDVLLAEANSRLGQHDEAVTGLRLLRTSARDAGRRAHLEEQLGRALLSAGRPAEALGHFSDALATRLATGASARSVQALRHGLDLARARARQ